MADQTLLNLHPFLTENNTKVSSGGTVKSYSHDLGGSGPVLCVVHGWPQSSYMWRHVLGPWKPLISLFVVELPGYGSSSAPPSADKRTVGRLILEALHAVFTPQAGVIWCGHDRGARIGHRLLVDALPAHNLRAAVLLDIVPTREQWAAFARPPASLAYYHWPLLALPGAAALVAGSGGGGEFARWNLERAAGANEAGRARFAEDGAVEHYVRQFGSEECVAGACADYAAGAGVDVEEQERDQREGRRVVGIPTLVVYSAANLGRMHDVPAAWRDWVDPEVVRFEAIGDGYGHYLPEECPERVAELVAEWVGKYGK